MFHRIKNYLRYTKLHYLYLRIKNPNWISWINNEVNFYKVFLKTDKLIFDLGANIGDKTHIFSFFSKKIVSYEPEEKLCEKLKLRFRNFKSIIIKNKVLSDKIGEINFYSVQDDESYSSILKNYTIDHPQLKNRKVIKKIKNSTNLNEEIKLHGVPYYIKIDCEGAEETILKDLDYFVDIISFEANLPKFYNPTIRIIDHLTTKFNYIINFREEGKFIFEFKENFERKHIQKLLKEYNNTCEIFLFKNKKKKGQ